MGWFQDEVGEEDSGAFTGELTWCPARDEIFKKKAPGRTFIRAQLFDDVGVRQGGQLVNPQCESESLFVVQGICATSQKTATDMTGQLADSRCGRQDWPSCKAIQSTRFSMS